VVNIGTVCGVYLTPALHVAVSGMLTNTHRTSPYRGAGRPEASYMIERLIDIAADEMGMALTPPKAQHHSAVRHALQDAADVQGST
jgi:hypothetical protein